MKGSMIFLVAVCLGWSVVFANATGATELDSRDDVCLQVITYAQNPETLTWITFPTPCDVPAGWTASPTPPEGDSTLLQYSREALDAAREGGFQQGLEGCGAGGSLLMKEDYTLLAEQVAMGDRNYRFTLNRFFNVSDPFGFYWNLDPASVVETLPTWLLTRIDTIKSEPVTNPPVEISRWLFNNETVYYIPPYCCDVMGELYNSRGELLCRPDGGIIGNGDGGCPGFLTDRENGETVWKDVRNTDDVPTIKLANGSTRDQWPGDLYQLDGAVVDKDALSVTVSYSGGCEEHEFTLVALNYFMESNPVQAEIYLAHEDNDDACEAFPTEELVFDLSPLRVEYERLYPDDAEAPIILQLSVPGKQEPQRILTYGTQ